MSVTHTATIRAAAWAARSLWSRRRACRRAGPASPGAVTARRSVRVGPAARRRGDLHLMVSDEAAAATTVTSELTQAKPLSGWRVASHLRRQLHPRRNGGGVVRGLSTKPSRIVESIWVVDTSEPNNSRRLPLTTTGFMRSRLGGVPGLGERNAVGAYIDDADSHPINLRGVARKLTPRPGHQGV